MYATQFCHTAAIELLLKVGADPNATNKAGHNALWLVNQNKYKYLSEADKKHIADLFWDAMTKNGPVRSGNAPRDRAGRGATSVSSYSGTTEKTALL